MHDSQTVAFEICSPFPKRADKSYDTKAASAGARPRSRWAWKPPLFTVAGRSWYFPTLVTVWHREPGGHRSGTVCTRTRRKTLANGRHRHVVRLAWLLHAHHWRVQLHPWRKFRRWAFTCCEWCGGRSRKGDPIDVSNGTYSETTAWWRGEEGLYHHDCSAVADAHGLCLCADPLFDRDTYGQCFACGKRRAYGREIDDYPKLAEKWARESAAWMAGWRAVLWPYGLVHTFIADAVSKAAWRPVEAEKERVAQLRRDLVDWQARACDVHATAETRQVAEDVAKTLADILTREGRHG